MMFKYLREHPDKRALVDQMGFGAFAHLPDRNLNQVLLKEIFDRYDIYDNTIHSDAASVKITTKKIGEALGLSYTGTVYETRVVWKNLSQEDKDTHKFFQGKSTVALQDLLKSTPVDTDDNRKLFMRAFICFIQKVFLLPNSMANITPVALLTIFDLENTSSRNWALHVHNFLLQELQKAKQNNSAAIHGCVYVLMIIYFHETEFGENSKKPEAQPPWLAYWTGDTLKKRLRQEKKLEAGLLKTGEMKAKKERMEKKKATKKKATNNGDSESDVESWKSSDSESDSESSSETESDPGPNQAEPVQREPPPQQEIRSKKRNDRAAAASHAALANAEAVVGSNEHLNTTQQSVAAPGSSQSENTPLVVAFPSIKKRRKQQKEERSTRQRLSRINENVELMPEGEGGEEAGRSASSTRY